MAYTLVLKQYRPTIKAVLWIDSVFAYINKHISYILCVSID